MCEVLIVSLCICGLVVEYLVAIEVTRVQFPANAVLSLFTHLETFRLKKFLIMNFLQFFPPPYAFVV